MAGFVWNYIVGQKSVNSGVICRKKPRILSLKPFIRKLVIKVINNIIYKETILIKFISSNKEVLYYSIKVEDLYRGLLFKSKSLSKVFNTKYYTIDKIFILKLKAYKEIFFIFLKGFKTSSILLAKNLSILVLSVGGSLGGYGLPNRVAQVLLPRS
ncbi:hypothetical protein B0T21DRAFT_344702 [Apiosordaria backusii]|uniref:Uncharacterized protein n=1 Tax=Apiosordaria backusii TaxID=314023 RepID=A0AA40K3F6_9PEZI|nr:hypothetical protein B0T21DRAFT_344702 [Apiosordaria backusii]